MLERPATVLGRAASWPYENLLRRPEKEDDPSRREGTSKSKAARAFGVGLSSVKCYVAMAREGKSLAPKQKKIGGCERKGRAAQSRLGPHRRGIGRGRGEGLSAVTAQDARSFFGDCG